MIAGIVASIMGGAIFSWLRSNLLIIGVATAVVVATNAMSALWFYTSGANAARAKCETASLRLRINTLERDLTVQRTVAASNANRIRVLTEGASEFDQKVSRYEEELAKSKQPASVSCALTADDIRRLRPSRRK